MKKLQELQRKQGSSTSLNKQQKKKIENVQSKSMLIVPQFSICSWQIDHQLRLFPQKDLDKKAGNSQDLQNDICKDDRCLKWRECLIKGRICESWTIFNLQNYLEE